MAKAKKFRVYLERQMHVSGFIVVEADGPEDAENHVIKMMNDGKKPLQTMDKRISWDDPAYLDNTFSTTGDVDEV